MLTIKLIFVNMSHQDSVSYAVVVDVTTPAISLFIFLIIIVNKFKRIYKLCCSLTILFPQKENHTAEKTNRSMMPNQERKYQMRRCDLCKLIINPSN